MQLKLEKLERIAKETMNEKSINDKLRLTLIEMFGLTISNKNIQEMVNDANWRLSIELLNSKSPKFSVDKSLLKSLSESKNASYRKFAMYLLPENKLNECVLNESDLEVLTVIAKRSELSVAKKIVESTSDELISIIVENRMLFEEDKKEEKKEYKKLGDSVKQKNIPELSDQWYATVAKQLLSDYGKDIESGWEVKVVKNYVLSNKSVGYLVDQEKLAKALKDLIEEKEDKILEQDALKESIQKLLCLDSDVLIESNHNVVKYEECLTEEKIYADVDKFNSLNESRTTKDYIESFQNLFEVKLNSSKLPIKCNIDISQYKNEKYLDKYCQAVSKKSNVKLDWVASADGISVNFYKTK